jgi:TRAP-type C4-dicarboxylate transport system substrate-binding protein
VQRLLVDTAREAAVFERKVFEDRLAAGEAEAKKAGMTFLTLSDREKWVDAVRPVWAEFGKSVPGAAEMIKAIQKS